MSERTADETITKLTRKAGAAHKVLKVDKTSVTVDRDGVEDKVSKDRFTRAPARLDPDTLRPQDADVQKQDSQSPKDSTQPPPRRSERHSSKQPKATVENKEEEYTVEKVVDFQENAYGGDYKSDGTGLVPNTTYDSQPRKCLSTSGQPTTDAAINCLSNRSETRRARLDEGAELRGGGNSPNPQLRSGAYNQEA